ncbi:MAG: hypothetical protein KJ645_00705, partial [Planctomycetes bacterium]|nr:hypothetical protein [Planctomycetota bacterium]
MTENDTQRAGLTEGQLNVLETFHRRCLRFLLYQLNDEFRIEPHPQANTASLGLGLIRLLKSSDARVFNMICQGVLHALIKAETHTNPFVAMAMAEMGMTKNKLFEEVLRQMRDESEKEGLLPSGAKIVGEEGPCTTLWNLALLERAERLSDHTSLAEPGLTYLKEHQQEILEDSPEMAARLL